MRLTESEALVWNSWPKPLMRKIQGCDFREIDGELVEVKTKALRSKQFEEMKRSFERGGRPKLVIVRANHIAVFDMVELRKPECSDKSDKER